ncbi:MAG: penicillin-binding protein 2 [Candidatus Sungbacteria bacterium]|nr:penicillin-binding protein 2 [Candidatus Sungbacteria bacterium]
MRLFLGRKSNIKRSDLAIEPEEIFMDATNSPGFRSEMHEGKIERPISKFSFLALVLLAASLFGVVIWRLFDMQLVRGSSFLAQAQANKTYPITIAAPRGLIYDRGFNKLVENIPTFVITLETDSIPSDREFGTALDKIANLVGKSPVELARANGLGEEIKDYDFLYSRSSWPAEIFVDSGELRDAILEIESHADDFPFVSVAQAERRYYPLGSYASHLVGYVGRPSREDLSGRKKLNYAIGKTGMEIQYEEFLAGTAGEKMIEVNAAGQNLRERHLVKAVPGRNIVLEIDSGLQRFAGAALERHIRALGKRAGAAVVMDPRDGAIRAMASFPAYDPNAFGSATRQDLERLLNDPAKPFFNRAVSGGYPSGSTIKPLVATAALEEKIIDPARAIYDPGFISVPNPYDPANPSIFKDWRALGWVDMRRALAMSANVYFYTIGGGYRDIKGLGIERIKKFLELFGWGRPLGIDIPGESGGLIPDPEVKKKTRPKDPVWRVGDTYITSIGQGDLQATPLQLTAAIAAIANGGTLWKPRLGKAVVDEEKNVIRSFHPEVIRSGIASPESLEIVRQGMRQAVTDGSAKLLNDLFFTSAGKTGTAETGVYGKNHGWFVGFAPYEQPEGVIAVLVEEGTGGATDALPIAKEVLYYYFTEASDSQLTRFQP